MTSTWNKSSNGCSGDLKRLSARGLYHESSNLSHVVGEVFGLVWTPGVEIVEATEMDYSDRVSYFAIIFDWSSFARDLNPHLRRSELRMT